MDKFVSNPIIDFKDTNDSFAITKIPPGYSKFYGGQIWDEDSKKWKRINSTTPGYEYYSWNMSEEKYPDGFIRIDSKFDRVVYKNMVIVNVLPPNLLCI